MDRVRKVLQHSRECMERPFVSLTYAQSLDGSITTHPGQMLHLSNAKSLVLTHQLRAAHDGILIGINTLLADNPRLTVRLVNGDNPIPIVLDSKLRFPLCAKLLNTGSRKLIIATSLDADPIKELQLKKAGAEVIRVPRKKSGKLNLKFLLRQLKIRGINSVMVEGGACIITDFLENQLAEQLILTISPIFIGGMRCLAKKVNFDLTPILANVHTENLDGDTIIMGDFLWKD